MAQQIKTGLGYDVHRFADNRKLMLGGIEIPYAKGLAGHSDADVILHAVCDALLGAMGKGDIGGHFPDTNPKYKDINSSRLLKQVNRLLMDDGWTINNLDIVVLAEEPKLAPYKDKMRAHIALELTMQEEDVNIKATTQEGLGSIGRGEGIAAFANVLITREN